MSTEPSQPPVESQDFIVHVPQGISIRDPETGRLVVSGEHKPRDPFWRRRLAQGDVSEVDPTAKPVKPPTSAKSSKE